MSNISAIILAAGEGKRMKSKYSKVLHKISGKPILEHVYNSVRNKVDEIIIVVGHKADDVKKYMGDKAKYALQEKQMGTGHAVMQAELVLDNFDGYTIVLCGDTPLVSEETIGNCLSYHMESKNSATVITAKLNNPTGYGRIVRDCSGNVLKIVEQKDASDEEKAIKEVNSGMYCFTTKHLFDALKNINNNNKQQEYYLTDTLEILLNKGYKVGAVKVNDNTEIIGINSRQQLAEAQKFMNKRIIEKHMISGVTITDPDTTYISSDVLIGMDTVIYPNTIIEAQSVVGEDCIIGPNVRMANSKVLDNSVIEYSILTDVTLEKSMKVGPFEYRKGK